MATDALLATGRIEELLEQAKSGISAYLDDAKQEGRIDQQLYDLAIGNVFPNLESWLTDPEIDRISPTLKQGISTSIENSEWDHLVNAFRQNARFGTGGIRGMMAFDRASIVRMKEEGILAPILKGPNTINDLVLLLTSVGVAQFGRQQKPKPFEKAVIGYDSRIRGGDLARCVAELFLANDYTVFFFDEPCPYPEVTFAIPDKEVQADVGIFISASHNDYRYNGYKLSCSNGSQFDPEQRDEMYEQYIANAETKDIVFCPFNEAAPGKLVFLGGAEKVDGFDYGDRELINMHARHCNHVLSFMLTDDLAQQQAAASDPLKIGFCAFHGSGNKAVPRLLRDVGFREDRIHSITHNRLDQLDGLFPCFSSEPGKEEQPDPGDPKAAEIAVGAFTTEFGNDEFDQTDILIGTDPDADRCGVTVKVPENQRHLFDGKDYTLLPADDMWALVVWYRLHREIEQYGEVRDADKKFVVLSHTTSDGIVRVARKHGLGVIKTWVGFAALAAGVRDTWEGKPTPRLVDGRTAPTDELCDPFICEFQDMDNGRRSINLAAMEQSNGFSILGGPPPDARSLGTGGHVRDKDGTFAALLVAEIAAWAKQRGTSIFELLDNEIYLDPDIGLFVTAYEPDPLIGEYPGIEGDRRKLAILRRALGQFQLARAGDVELGGLRVKSGCIYRTGKYDRIYPPTYEFQFPDEGVRLFFDDEKLDHVTIRPSGTGNSLRFHVQLHAAVNTDNLIETKARLRDQAQAVVDDVRLILKAPREA